MATKAERLQEHADQVARERASGLEHNRYRCPHCRQELWMVKPPEGSVERHSECHGCLKTFTAVSCANLGVDLYVPGMRPMHNDELVARIMAEQSYGPLLQVFIISALGSYCEGVQKAPDGFMANNMVDEDAWRQLAAFVKDELDNRRLVPDEED